MSRSMSGDRHTPGAGRVYRHERDGIRHYTSRHPPAGAGAAASVVVAWAAPCRGCASPAQPSSPPAVLQPDAYRREITEASRRFGVEEAMVRAVIHAESAFDPRAVSRAGARGLMQLMPATARRFGVEDSFDASQNINGGVAYLAWLLHRFDGDVVLAVAAYNAGEGAVERHAGLPPYAETRGYVQRVVQLLARYREREA